jgi:bacterioferritin
LTRLRNLSNLCQELGIRPQQVELDALPDLQAGIAYCEAHKDYVTRDLFDEILKSEEEPVDWLETQLDLIDKMGEKNYMLSAK